MITPVRRLFAKDISKQILQHLFRLTSIKMSSFTSKALGHVIGQVATTIVDGREGLTLKLIATRLQLSLRLTAEQIDDYYDAFIMFPLDNNQRISVSSLQEFYSKSDIDLSSDDCLKAMRSFVGIENIVSIDFESFVHSMERWEKRV
jgi:hypothetical protein